jgi:hypothetical protein
MWRGRKKRSVNKARRGLRIKLTLTIPWSQISSFLNGEEMNLCWSRYPVWDTLLWCTQTQRSLPWSRLAMTVVAVEAWKMVRLRGWLGDKTKNTCSSSELQCEGKRDNAKVFPWVTGRLRLLVSEMERARQHQFGMGELKTGWDIMHLWCLLDLHMWLWSTGRGPGWSSIFRSQQSMCGMGSQENRWEQL